MQSVRFAAGDLFYFAGQISLTTGTQWGGRGQIRNADGSALPITLGNLDVQVQVVGEDQIFVVVSKPADATAQWPHPTERGETVRLYFDYELYDINGDDLGDTVISSETVLVLVEMPTCPLPGGLVDIELSRLPTQYRESVKLQAYLRAVLGEVEAAAIATCSIPNYFDIDTAIGDQLTIIGKWMGFPRCHCVCTAQPVYGFDCEGYPQPIAGPCDEGAVWADCDGQLQGDICLDEDELYRKFLKVRRYQMLGLFDRESLLASIRIFWGQTAWIVDAEYCSVVVSPGFALTPTEQSLVQILARILPIAPGIRAQIWLDTRPILGFGDGWAGPCEVVATKVYGFECADVTPAFEIVGPCDEDGTYADCLASGIGAGVMLCPVDMNSIC